uniref:Variant surface glycoprotein 1125.2930 n=1 Tax=Trypanosoma brucei TaxID=5691 RepID=A0A1J0R9C6_9TRYP|nr:variant surface glycoprotein 1125.2930 [Trypanosoma brucei]
MKGQIEAENLDAQQTHPEAVKKIIFKAIFGETTKTGVAEEGKTITKKYSWSGSCGTNCAKSIVGDMLCICGQASSDEAQVCHTSNLAINWATDALSSVPTILEQCPSGAKHKITAGALRALVERISGRLRHETKNNALCSYLGAVGAECACDGGSNGQACVDYTKYFTKGNAGSGIYEIARVKHLHHAIERINQMTAAAALAAQKKNAVGELLKRAKLAYSTTINLPIEEQTASPTTGKHTQQEIMDKKGAQCEAITKEADCKKNGNCKWEALTTKSKESTAN